MARWSSFSAAQFGSFAATSRLTTGTAAYGGPPDYLATNPDTNTGLQVTNFSDSIINVNGGFLYVTEIFTRHNLITPLDRLHAVRRDPSEHVVFDRLFLSPRGRLEGQDAHVRRSQFFIRVERT